MACICSYENHMKRLRQSFTEIEFAIIKEIQTRKWNLRKLNEIGVLDSTKPEICNDNKFFFTKNWLDNYKVIKLIHIICLNNYVFNIFLGSVVFRTIINNIQNLRNLKLI